MMWKWYGIACKLALLTNGKWHMGFRLVPKTATFCIVMAVIFALFCQIGYFKGQLRQNG